MKTSLAPYTENMHISRLARPALRPFVKQIWASSLPTAESTQARFRQEKVLPTAYMHLVFRLDTPLILLDSHKRPTALRIAPEQGIIGGARASYYLKDNQQASRSVGAMLQAGAAQILLGARADELAHCHTPLSDCWGRLSFEIHDKLAGLDSLQQQIDCFEDYLCKQLQLSAALLWPGLTPALQALEQGLSIEQVVKQSGFSHRYFNHLFQSAVGLSPKRYSRVRRFSQLLTQVKANAQSAYSWADLALDLGYSDQAHLSREFQTFAGLSPRRYRELAPKFKHHLPDFNQVNFFQEKNTESMIK